MGFVLFLLFCVGAFFVIKSLMGGKAASDHTQAAIAEVNTMEEEPFLMPTWSGDAGQKAEFLTSLAHFADKKRIPKSFSREMIFDDKGSAFILHFVTLLERRGIPFRQQQIAAGDLLLFVWGRSPPHHRQAFMHEDLEAERRLRATL